MRFPRPIKRKKLRYEVSHQGRYEQFKIYVPDADNSTQTILPLSRE